MKASRNNNQELVNDLKIKNIIKTTKVARVFTEVDRADFTNFLPHTDCATPIGYNSHLKAPNMHAVILVFYSLTIYNISKGVIKGTPHR
jgi:protein-L-isoaspartate O-methyltransferase